MEQAQNPIRNNNRGNVVNHNNVNMDPRNNHVIHPQAPAAAAPPPGQQPQGSRPSSPRSATSTTSNSHYSLPPRKPDPSMTITAAELQRAREIKAALEASHKVTSAYPSYRLTDYDYAQLAITTMNSITANNMDQQQQQQLLEDRMYKLQCFRKEYKLQDTVEEGLLLVHQLMQKFPGYILSVDFAPRYGSYIFVFDMAAFFPHRIEQLCDERIFMGGLYYLFQCLSTNLKAIRSGVVFIGECDGMTADNFDAHWEEKRVHELFAHYPFCYKECLWLNTVTEANIAYGLLKPIVSRDFLATWRLGCQLDGYDGRIDSLFNLPTMEIAQEQLLQRIETYLMERYEQNGNTFSLARAVVDPPVPAAAAAGVNPNVGAAAANADQGVPADDINGAGGPDAAADLGEQAQNVVGGPDGNPNAAGMIPH